jgi:hypothetical protein
MRDPSQILCELRGIPSGTVKRHRQVLFVACVVGLLAVVLDVHEGDQVVVRGLSQFPLPQTCASRAWMGVRCPGCGLTRSVIHLAQGDLSASWRDHRLGFLMAGVIALQIPYRVLALRRPERPLIPPWLQNVLGNLLIFLLVANWLFDVVHLAHP